MRLQAGARDCAFACLSGAFLILSFPTFDVGLVAWGALVPLLWSLEGKGPNGAFFLSSLTGVIFFPGIFRWIWTVPAFNVLDGALITIYLSLYFGVWGLALAWTRKRTGLPTALIAPPLWVTLEYIRGHVSFLSLPWMLLGYSQHPYPSMIQITSLTGVYGLSFLIVLCNAALSAGLLYVRAGSAGTRSLRRSPVLSLSVAGFLVAFTLLYGVFTLSGAGGTPGERLSVALVQANIPQERKWDGAYLEKTLERYASLTRQAAQQRPTLIVWPETAIPADFRHHDQLKRKVVQIALDARTPILAGTAEHAKFSDRTLRGKYYNSMVLLTPDGKLAGEYQKIALVPFGEYEPLRGTFAWPRAIASVSGNYVPGTRYSLFTVDGVAFGAVICWETIFPDLFREFVARGARFMVNATNEAWFQETSAPYQFLAMSVLRAAENRVAVARAANTGISAVIDPFGRVSHRLRGADQRELFVEGVLVAEVPLAQEKTFYTRHGDVFAFLQIALAALLLLSASLPHGVRRRLGFGEAR